MRYQRYSDYVNKRELVRTLAASEPDHALEVAREITDPWYRCQSLAQVAWHTGKRQQFEKIIHDALRAAREQDEPNRIVSAAAWPVRAMAEKDNPGLTNVVNELLVVVDRESNPVRRADALFLLFEATYRVRSLREIVLMPLLDACNKMHSWKRIRILSNIALVLAIDDRDGANEVIEMFGEHRKASQIRHDIYYGKWIGPHEFFPFYAMPES